MLAGSSTVNGTEIPPTQHPLSLSHSSDPHPTLNPSVPAYDPLATSTAAAPPVTTAAVTVVTTVVAPPVMITTTPTPTAGLLTGKHVALSPSIL